MHAMHMPPGETFFAHGIDLHENVQLVSPARLISVSDPPPRGVFISI
jgi:hypothetical protein